MRLTSLLGALLFASAPVSVSTPALTAEPAVACQFYMDEVLAQFSETGAPFVMVADADLAAVAAEAGTVTGLDYTGATRGFFVNIDGTDALGLEVGGCLLPAIVIPSEPAPASTSLSGKTAFGTFA